jgi:hypothetical protein
VETDKIRMLGNPDFHHGLLRARKMTSISKGHILPDRPVHLLIDSTGLKVVGAGEGLREKHGAKARRTWRKLYLSVGGETGMIIASTLPETMSEILRKWRLCWIK